MHLIWWQGANNAPDDYKALHDGFRELNPHWGVEWWDRERILDTDLPHRDLIEHAERYAPEDSAHQKDRKPDVCSSDLPLRGMIHGARHAPNLVARGQQCPRRLQGATRRVPRTQPPLGRRVVGPGAHPGHRPTAPRPHRVRRTVRARG